MFEGTMMMRFEPSILARLVIAYYEKFGRHVTDGALRTLDARELAPGLEIAIAMGTPLSETGWEPEYPFPYGPFGCCLELGEKGTPAKRPDGEWVH